MTPSRPRFTTRTARHHAEERLRHAPKVGSPATADQAGAFAVTLTGEVDLMADVELTRMVEDFRTAGSARATVDLRAVTFIDTAALAFLARLREIALERGGTVTVIGASGASLRTLTLVHFDTIFDLVA